MAAAPDRNLSIEQPHLFSGSVRDNIRSVTRILFTSAGQILEQGAHHDLIRAKLRYFDLYTNQFTHERESELLHHPLELQDT